MFEPFDPSEAEVQELSNLETSVRRKRLWPRVMLLIRRIHLYSGVLLFPWVLLYGITGAMYNHQGLFPDVCIRPVEAGVLAETPMADFPSAEAFAQQVVDALQSASGDAKVELAENHRAEFTNSPMFEVFAEGERHVVHIDPVSQSSKVVTFPDNNETPEPVLDDIHNIRLDPDPHEAARQSVHAILSEAGIKSTRNPQPFGFSKLNFLASVNGEPARVTYVLKDGHVDVTRYTGEDGFTPRGFFLRLHTSHGQSPHWNGRSIWSFVVDVMAISMVCWGLSGLLMWWQIKRTRLLGSALILLSIVTAAWLYFGMQDFYSTTKL